MIKKSLLSFGLFATASGALAQIPMFHEGFDAEQTKLNTDLGWWEDINTQEGDERSLDFQNQFAGAGCLKFVNVADPTCENQQWQRAIKFRNLPLQEGKSYRLSFMLKGSSEYEGGKKTVVRPSIMQGEENADIPMLDAEGNEVNYSFNNIKDEYQSYSTVFYYRSAKQIHDKYTEKYPDRPELKDVFFATINIFNPGTFYLDEVEVVESYINQIQNAGFNIKVDFGYKTNIPQLIAASQHEGRLIMPKDCAKVTVDGVEVEVESVELQDNFLYVFLMEEAPEDAKIVVEFTNPTDEAYQIKYTDNAAPVVEGNVVPNFSDEQSIFNADVAEASSFAWDEAKLTSSNPLNESFAIDENTNEISVTFDHPVYTRGTDDVNAPVAKLSGGVEETLVLKEGQDEISNTIVFVRPNSTPLPKGSYKVEVNYITTDNHIEAFAEGDPLILTFEVGKPKVAETTYTELVDVNGTFTANDGSVPEGWNLYINYGAENEEVRTSEWSGGGSRAFKYNNSNVEAAVYMRDWEGKAVLTYGEQAEHPFTLPAGKIELRVLSAGWSTTGTFKVTVKEAGENGAVVVDENILVTTSLAKDKTGQFQLDPIQFESKGGNYIYMVELVNSNELLAGGFKPYSYTQSEGDKLETETIVAGSFADCSNNFIPAAGTGWRIHRGDAIRTPGADGGWGGNCATGGGGPRVFALGYKNMAGKGVYLDGGANNILTYGEFLTYEEDGENGREEKPEKILELNAAKYQFTYYSTLWKAEGVKLTMEIIKQEEGFNGTPIFTKVDVIDTKSPGGNANDGSVEAMKTQFTWDCPAPGKYMLRFYTNGEGFVGNIKVETTASMALQQALALREALAPAIDEAAIANADENYRGTTRDALNKAIADYTDPDFHTKAQYDAAIADLAKVVKAMSTRRDNLGKFPSTVEGLKAGLEAAQGTKFEALDEFPVVQEGYEKYKDVDPVLLSDEELSDAVSKLGNLGQLLKNMVEVCIPTLLTKQIVNLAGMIVELDSEAENHEYVIASGNAISDDQALVTNLKKLYVGKLYEKCAEGNPFVAYDPEIEIETPVEIDASALIQNNIFYSNAKANMVSASAPAKPENFPGWDINVISGEIAAIFTTQWDGPYATDVKPWENCAVKTGWGSHEYNVEQVVNLLPVANYTASIMVGEDGGAPHESYAYVVVGEEKTTQEYVGEPDGTVTRDNNKASNTKEFNDLIPMPVDNFASITIGAHMKVNGGFANVDNAKLVMVSKVEGFDYAAAAKAIFDEIANGIEQTELAPEGNAVVTYYDLTGKRVANPTGVTIKVESYKNGYMKVSKQIVK